MGSDLCIRDKRAGDATAQHSIWNVLKRYANTHFCDSRCLKSVAALNCEGKGVEGLAARLAVSAANPERYRFLEPDLQGIQTV